MKEALIAVERSKRDSICWARLIRTTKQIQNGAYSVEYSFGTVS